MERGDYMYIPDFWCGVAATILIEVLAGILFIFFMVAGGEKDEEGK